MNLFGALRRTCCCRVRSAWTTPGVVRVRAAADQARRFGAVPQLYSAVRAQQQVVRNLTDGWCDATGMPLIDTSNWCRTWVRPAAAAWSSLQR